MCDDGLEHSAENRDTNVVALFFFLYVTAWDMSDLSSSTMPFSSALIPPKLFSSLQTMSPLRSSRALHDVSHIPKDDVHGAPSSLSLAD